MLLDVRDIDGVRRGFAVRLWTINRVLRFTGLRLIVVLNDDPEGDWSTALGVRWFGLPGSAGWRKIEG